MSAAAKDVLGAAVNWAHQEFRARGLNVVTVSIHAVVEGGEDDPYTYAHVASDRLGDDRQKQILANALTTTAAELCP